MDKSTGVRSDQTAVLASTRSATAYPDALRPKIRASRAKTIPSYSSITGGKTSAFLMIFEGLGTEYAVVEFSEAGNATFDQLLDQLMENKKGLAQGVLQGDEFLKPQDNEDDSGLQVFSALESSVNAGRSTV